MFDISIVQFFLSSALPFSLFLVKIEAEREELLGLNGGFTFLASCRHRSLVFEKFDSPPPRDLSVCLGSLMRRKGQAGIIWSQNGVRVEKRRISLGSHHIARDRGGGISSAMAFDRRVSIIRILSWV